MAAGVGVRVKQTGRIKGPNLDNGALTAIGEAMVAAQKDRWAKGLNADGVPAKKLSPRYAAIKRKVLKKEPIRDNYMTGALSRNFSLRKANNGSIRAEATSREARAHANSATRFEQMIGFAGSDQLAVFKTAQAEYGAHLDKAWVPISG